MKIVATFLNLPWALVGILAGIISLPNKISFNSKPVALVVSVRSFWWYTWLQNGTRAMAIGNVVLMGRNALENDLEHELVHVEQAMRVPLIHPILYWVETLKNGYKNNKYEKEAYTNAGNIYIEK